MADDVFGPVDLIRSRNCRMASDASPNPDIPTVTDYQIGVKNVTLAPDFVGFAILDGVF